MKILSHQEIQRKVRRIALQILENNFEAEELFIGGINNNGQLFANLLLRELDIQSDMSVTSFNVRLSPADPLSNEVSFDIEVDRLKNKRVIIVDDVANTGRTLFYACKPLMKVIPKKLEMAVLVDRKHKSFPIYVGYVGLSLATTLGETISVSLNEPEHMEATLK